MNKVVTGNRNSSKNKRVSSSFRPREREYPHPMRPIPSTFLFDSTWTPERRNPAREPLESFFLPSRMCVCVCVCLGRICFSFFLLSQMEKFFSSPVTPTSASAILSSSSSSFTPSSSLRSGSVSRKSELLRSLASLTGTRSSAERDSHSPRTESGILLRSPSSSPSPTSSPLTRAKLFEERNDSARRKSSSPETRSHSMSRTHHVDRTYSGG